METNTAMGPSSSMGSVWNDFRAGSLTGGRLVDSTAAPAKARPDMYAASSVATPPVRNFFI